jgi:hypothetical protein
MVKSVGKPDARKGHVRFDERGRGNGRLPVGPAPRSSSTLHQTSIPSSNAVKISSGASRFADNQVLPDSDRHHIAVLTPGRRWLRIQCHSRIGIAWAPGAAGAKTPKTIPRAGFGIFYDWFSLSNTLTAARYKGTVQQQYIIENPAFFTTVPPIPSLARIPDASQSIREVDSHLRASYLFQSAFTSKGGCGGEARSRRQDRARPQRRRTDFPQPGVQRGRQRCTFSRRHQPQENRRRTPVAPRRIAWS